MRKMQILTLKGSPDIEVQVRNLAQARRMSLRVSHLDGRVMLSVPKRAKRSDIMGFLCEKEVWVREVLHTLPDRSKVGVGCAIPIFGYEREIRFAKVQEPVLTTHELLVPECSKAVEKAVQCFLKGQAQEVLTLASDKYAQQLEVSYSNVRIRDTRSRWGSCSSRGSLMYSWRLVMAPEAIYEYVAAHEVAHLIEMNHSADFWSLVEKLRPSYPQERLWLKKHGAKLHQWDFSGA